MDIGNELVFNEAYYGRTETLSEIESLLDVMLSKMKTDPHHYDYSTSKENKMLEKLFIKQFGFKEIQIIWQPYDVSQLNICTLCSSDLLFGGGRNFIVDKKRGYYDKDHKHVMVLYLSTTHPGYLNLSTKEYLAIILHEMGHNFDLSPYNTINIIQQYVLAGLELYKISKQRPLTSEEIAQFIGSTIGNAVSLFNPVKSFIGKANKFILLLIDKIPGLKLLNKVILKLSFFIQKYGNIVLLPINIVSSIVSAGRNILLNPLYHLMTTAARKGEQFSDSFAAAYGYGTEIATALVKIEAASLPIKMDLKNQPKIFVLLTDIASVSIEVLNMVSATSNIHGSTATRLMSNIQALEREIENGDYKPDVKNEMKEQLNSCKEIYENYINGNESGINLFLTGWFRRVINTLFKGRADYISKLFPDYLALGESVEFEESVIAAYENGSIDYDEFSFIIDTLC